MQFRLDALAIRPERYGLFDRVIFAVFVLGLPAVVAARQGIFRDGDVSWHVAAGRWIMEHRAVPRTDPFSHAMAGQPWVSHEWLAEIVYAAAFNAGSYAGLSAVVFLALVALYAIVFAHLRPRVGPIGLLASFAALFIVLQPFVLARPHLLSWPLIAGWTAVLMNSRDKGRAPPLAMAAAMIIWSNLHASFIVGFIVAGAIGLDAMIASRWDRQLFKGWLIFGLAALAAAAINANGLDGLLHPLSISGMESLKDIGEWRPSSTDNAWQFFPVLLIGIGVVLAFRPKLTIGEGALLLLALGMAFLHIRHQSLFILLAALILPLRLSSADRSHPLFETRREARVAIVGALLVAIALTILLSLRPVRPEESHQNPLNLIAHIPPELRDRPVLNEYSMGGPLILHGVPVYIDGRADMYGDTWVQDYIKIVNGDEALFAQAVRDHGIRWTMLRRKNPLAKKLDSLPGWRQVYADEVGVIHAKS